MIWPLVWLGVLASVVYLAVRTVMRSRTAGPPLEACCPTCAAPVQAAFLRCPECGTRLKRNCPGCGQIVKTTWDVCPFCEVDLREGRAVHEVIAAPVAPQPKG